MPLPRSVSRDPEEDGAGAGAGEEGAAERGGAEIAGALGMGAGARMLGAGVYGRAGALTGADGRGTDAAGGV